MILGGGAQNVPRPSSARRSEREREKARAATPIAGRGPAASPHGAAAGPFGRRVQPGSFLTQPGGIQSSPSLR
jgi:hypothetical protein